MFNFSFLSQTKDRKYLFLALILCVAFTAIYVSGKGAETAHSVNPVAEDALDDLRQAESQISKKFSSKESIEQFFKDNPGIQIVITILTFGGVLLFFGGLCVNLTFFFNRRFRSAVCETRIYEDPVDWNFTMLFKLIVLFLSASLGLSVTLALLKSFVFYDVSMNAMILIETTLVDIACVLIIVYLLKSYGGSWRSLGVHRPRNGYLPEVLAGAGMYLAIFPLFMLGLVVLVFLAKITGYEPPPHPLVYIFLEEETKNPLLIYYSIFLASIIAPTLEEIFFRGFLYPIVKKSWGVLIATVLTAAVFAAIHQNIFAFLPIMILGAGLAFIYEKRGSLVSAITLHLIHNSIFISYFFLVKKVLTAAS